MKKIGIIALLIIGVGIELYFWNNIDKKEKQGKQDKQIEIVHLKDNDVAHSIFKSSYQKAIQKVEKMSLEEKVGQLFLVRYDKNQTTEYNNYYPGGYILFAKDFENHTKDSMKEELQELQRSSKHKLIIGVDEEGGFVTRVSSNKAFREERFKFPKEYYKEGGYSLLEEMENEKALLLKDIGINLNLAPVADVSTNPNDFIYRRAFGESAEETAIFIGNMVKYANNNGINSCLKHFPGYGNNVDTHTGIAIDKREYQYFEENDFLPFEAGIKENVPSILVSHNIMEKVDDQYPSSLSQKVISILRDKLKFTGIIMTDDLAMDAVKSYVEDSKAATLAVNAGNDMIITSDFIKMHDEVLQSVKDGMIKEEVLNKAVIRIMAWKYKTLQ